VPGTAISVGVDTALNAIVESVDRLKLSAASSRARLFLIEVMGDKCGFLAVMAALAGGADSAYIHENVVSVETMQGDIAYLRRKFAAQFKKALIIRNEQCSPMYDMPFMQAVFEQEGTRRNEVSYTVRNSVLGHLQQGNRPTPYDRVRAARLASATVDFVMENLGKAASDGLVYTDAKESAVMAGAHEHAVVFTPLVDMVPKTDFNAPSEGTLVREPAGADQAARAEQR
jgi:6-phosphofructokinase 1